MAQQDGPDGAAKRFWCFITRAMGAFASERGSATIEAVIWMPAFFAIFALIADSSIIFGSESQVLRIVQDANRAFSIGRLTTVQEVQTQIKGAIDKISPNAVVSTSVANALISTSVVLPLSDITATGLVTAFLSGKVTVSAEHLMED